MKNPKTDLLPNLLDKPYDGFVGVILKKKFITFLNGRGFIGVKCDYHKMTE